MRAKSSVTTLLDKTLEHVRNQTAKTNLNTAMADLPTPGVPQIKISCSFTRTFENTLNFFLT
jgi:hypothetical protein